MRISLQTTGSGISDLVIGVWTKIRLGAPLHDPLSWQCPVGAVDNDQAKRFGCKTASISHLRNAVQSTQARLFPWQGEF